MGIEPIIGIGRLSQAFPPSEPCTRLSSHTAQAIHFYNISPYFSLNIKLSFTKLKTVFNIKKNHPFSSRPPFGVGYYPYLVHYIGAFAF